VDRIDTAYNYAGGASQRLLRDRVGDLLERLRISTNVGFFPGSCPVEHSLEPGRLALAVRESSTTLGVTPEIMFLHNPERGLTGLSRERAADLLRAACEALPPTPGGARPGASPLGCPAHCYRPLPRSLTLRRGR
jgi:pyridoxine 4-dehydrogenase